MQDKDNEMINRTLTASLETAAAEAMDAIDNDNGRLERIVGEKTKRNEDSSSDEILRKGTLVNPSRVTKTRKGIKLDKKYV